MREGDKGGEKYRPSEFVERCPTHTKKKSNKVIKSRQTGRQRLPLNNWGKKALKLKLTLCKQPSHGRTRTSRSKRFNGSGFFGSDLGVFIPRIIGKLCRRPNHQPWYAKWKLSWNTVYSKYTLHTVVPLHDFARSAPICTTTRSVGDY